MDKKQKFKSKGQPRFYDSIGSAMYCYSIVEAFAAGEHNGLLTRDELRACFDVPYRDIKKHIPVSYPYRVLDVWEHAQWCRARDVARWADLHKNAVMRLAHAGYATWEFKPWFHKERALTLEGALRIGKYMKLRPFLRKAMGVAGRFDIDALLVLPLSELLGIITRPQLIRMFCSSHGLLAYRGGQ